MTDENQKLYRVRLRGLNSVISTNYGNPYVIAISPNEALAKVQANVNDKDLGFTKDREMQSIELLAEVGDYPTCRTQIFL